MYKNVFTIFSLLLAFSSLSRCPAKTNTCPPLLLTNHHFSYIPEYIHRVKHSHNSLDAQTISTFDSSNGDNPGFYHKYASAWSQLQSSAAIMHSGSYKPGLYNHHHHFHGHRRSGGAINEGFRDSNEITLNADVYARSSSGGSAGSGGSSEHGRRGGGGGGKRGSGGDHEWQHLTRAKY